MKLHVPTTHGTALTGVPKERRAMDLVRFVAGWNPLAMTIILTLVGLGFDWFAFYLFPSIWEGNRLHGDTALTVGFIYLVAIGIQGASLWYLRQLNLPYPEITTAIWLGGITLFNFIVPLWAGEVRWPVDVWILLVVGNTCIIAASVRIATLPTVLSQ